MENNTLFKTIEQLKETLTDISSARQQVTDTVTAYALTQKEIHSYIICFYKRRKFLSIFPLLNHK